MHQILDTNEDNRIVAIIPKHRDAVTIRRLLERHSTVDQDPPRFKIKRTHGTWFGPKGKL